jgi:hypothetical protein
MGIHKEPDIPRYWNTDINKRPIHSISKTYIYHYAVLSKLNHIAIYLVLRMIEEQGTTNLLIESGGIRLNL